jgi:pyruvate dehydrogenase E1 component alpha subunit
VKEKTANEIDLAVEEMEKYPASNVEDVFDHVFAEMPPQLAEQKESYLAHLERR